MTFFLCFYLNIGRLLQHVNANMFSDIFRCLNGPQIQGISQLLKQSDWAQIQDFKRYHNDVTFIER